MQTKKPRLAHLVLVFLAACLVLAALSVTPQDTTHADNLAKPMALNCTGVGTISPAKITTGNSTTITVQSSGSSFDGTSPTPTTTNQIWIRSSNGTTTTLATTFINASELRGVVPGNVKTGKYTVLVVDGGTQCALGTKLTVVSNVAKATDTPEPTTFVRPQTQVVSYSPSPATVYPGENLDFVITLQSVGPVVARQVTASFVTGDLVPRETGGVHFIGDTEPGATPSFPPPLRVPSAQDRGDYEDGGDLL